jgi:methylenetetrahydrofolate dehydrogenase (NADP+) / methenyltetrahydrofolate cyclohydrolase
MDVTRRLRELGVARDGDALESAGEQRARPAGALVVGGAVATAEPLHRLRQPAVTGPAEEVEVVGHERVGVEFDGEALECFRCQLLEEGPVAVSAEDVLAIGPTVVDVEPLAPGEVTVMSAHALIVTSGCHGLPVLLPVGVGSGRAGARRGRVRTGRWWRRRVGAMTAVVMDGNALRDEIVSGIRTTVEAAGSPAICLATVLVGDDGPSQRYVRSKHAKAAEAGLTSRHVDLPATATQAEVESVVRGLVLDRHVHGILVQLPLPVGLDPEPVIDLIPPEKDVDGLTERSMGRLVRGRPGLVGCTPLGVMRLLERYDITTSGKRAVVIGRSTLVGLPLSLLLARKGVDATVTMAHSRTPDMAAVVRESDIIVAAAGQARMITADMVTPGATVIDVGVSRTEAGIVGDVDYDAVREVAGHITPMPGGTGPMTIASLMENTLTAARLQGVAI